MSQLLTVDSCADLLNIRPRMVYSLIKEGELPAAKIGRLIRIKPQDVETFLDRRTTRAEHSCAVTNC